jgi:uroporphyrinogen-III synthase
MSLRPLDGFVIGITADRRWGEQAELLGRRGASIVHGPTISTLYLGDDEDLRRATHAVIDKPPDYLVATTGIGVRAWFEMASAWGLGDEVVDALGDARIIARGAKASAAVQAGGLSVWARSPNEQMDELAALLLQEDLTGKRVAVQEYGAPNPDLTELLAGAGAEVVKVPVYRWRMPEDPSAAAKLIELACDGRIDAITFTSAPAVHNLFAIAESVDRTEPLRRAFNRGIAAACVGPVCAEGARQQGVEAPLVPDVGRLGLLVRAISEHFADRRRLLTLAGHELVVQGSMIEVEGDVIELTPKERAVFHLLAAAPGTVVPRSAFLRRVWGSEDADPHVLEVTIGRLRRRLGACAPALEAFPGRGYRLNPEPPVN